MRFTACTLAAFLVCAAGLAWAADVEPAKPDRAAPGAPQGVQSPDPPTQPAPPAEKASDDTRLDLEKPKDAPKSEPQTIENPRVRESWWQKLLRDAPNCKSFSDGCRVCSATYVCSNIGIACQPREWACNDVTPGAKPDTNPNAKPETKPDAKP